MVGFLRNLMLLLTSLVLWSPKALTADDACLRMGVILQLETLELVTGAAKRIFDRADLCLELVEIPVRRAEQMILHGDLDGEMLRTGLWVQQHADDIVALPTPFFIDQMYALSLKSQQLDIQTLADLKPYRVAILGGHRWAEQRIAELGIDPVKTTSAVRYMELLRVGRVDAGLLEKSLLNLIPDRTDIALHPLEPLPYYTVLRREHKSLVPRLDAALRWVQENPLPKN